MEIDNELATLHRMSTKQLQRRYAELTGDATASSNRPWLLKRLAWRLQAEAHGGLSDRARARAAELANDADLRLMPPRDEPPTLKVATVPPPETTPSDNRLPPPGSVLTRKYKGREVRVRVLAQGFEWDGKVYPSLSAAAKAITGSHCNGFLFFQLTGEKP